MARANVPRTNRWLFYVAVSAAAFLGAELIVITTTGQRFRGGPSTIVGWAFEVVVASLLVGLGHREASGRRRTDHLVAQLDDALASITALTESSFSLLRLDELLSRLLGRLREVLRVEVVSVVLLNEDRSEMVARATDGREGLDRGAVVFRVGEGFLGRTLNSRQATTTNDPRDLVALSLHLKGQFSSAAACPVHVGSDLIGLCVAATASTVQFTERDLHLLQVVADRAGLGIEQTRLNEAEQRSRIELERARRHTSMLVDASEVLSRAKEDYESNLVALGKTALAQFADWCVIDIVDSSGSINRLVTLHQGSSEEESEGEIRRWIPGYASIVEDALSRGNFGSEVTNRFRPDQEMDQVLTSTLPEASFISAIIEVSDAPFGVITFGSDGDRHGYERSTAETTKDIARRIGVAVERVLLFRDARDAARRAQRIATQLQLLIEVSLDIPRLGQIVDVARNMLNHARELLEADTAVISLDTGGNTSLRIGIDDAGIHVDDVETSRSRSISRIDRLRPDDRRTSTVTIGGPEAVPHGSLAVFRSASGPEFNADDEAVLGLMAQMTTRALESAQLYGAIQDSESRWRALVETAPIAIVEVDLHGGILWWNQAASGLFSWEETNGPRAHEPAFPDKMTEELTDLWSRVADGEEVVGREQIGVPIGPTLKDLVVSGAPLTGRDSAVRGILTLVGDITERRRLEADLRQAQRVDAVGQFAGNVAHDFNNLLALITGYADLLRRQSGLDSRAIELIGEMKTATDRASILTGQLLTISRREPAKRVVMSPVDALESIREVLDRIIGSSIELRLDLDSTTRAVLIDPGGFQQVVLNLAINARDAMPNGGELTISSDNFQSRPTPEASSGPSREYVRIVVHDNGSGMSKEVLAQCFEPFFTTKGPSKGTGLGLPAVRGVIDEAGGEVRVESTLGSGTTFEILLPASTEQIQEQALIPPGITGPSSANIAVVDDDDDVRHLICQVLERAGYRVFEAESGPAALGLVRRLEGGIDLLVSDVVMPEMSGLDLVTAVRASYPAMKVLFVSGNTKGIELPRSSNGSLGYLAKPFVPSDLLGRIRELLTRAPGTSPPPALSLGERPGGRSTP